MVLIKFLTKIIKSDQCLQTEFCKIILHKFMNKSKLVDFLCVNPLSVQTLFCLPIK